MSLDQERPEREEGMTKAVPEDSRPPVRQVLLSRVAQLRRKADRYEALALSLPDLFHNEANTALYDLLSKEEL